MHALDIICEDGPVIAVNKPNGLISQGAPPGQENLIEQVKDYIKLKYDKPGNVYLGVTHRLDRPVSGVVVFSRNSKCAARISEQFAQRTVEKRYLAVLETPPEQPEGKLEDWLFRVPDESRVIISREHNTQAKPANLSYQTIAVKQGKALVSILLGTGRMHQIRIQFGSRGYPIIGDLQYGAKQHFPGFQNAPRSEEPIALHAWRLKLKHPIRYDDLTITAKIPESWKRLGFSDDLIQ